jgi:Ni,Fe-hydrogenase III large subunit
MRRFVGPRPTPLPLAPWRDAVLGALAAGARPVTLYGQRGEADDRLVTAVLQAADGALTPLRGRLTVDDPYVPFTEGHPADAVGVSLAFHAFERELHEQFGIAMPGHPWLKPVRFEGGAGQQAMVAYPWYTVEGKDLHEVAVGPIHAGVIEPGSFRFVCHGERVLHLEIQLGYQHRGVEPLLLRTPIGKLLPLVETIAGDTSVAYAWAASAALEALAGAPPGEGTDLSRAILLELERIAMHLVGLSGVGTDIGHLQAGTTYGRLRTTAINTTMRLCGSRFGRSGVRPGAPAYTLDGAAREALSGALDLLSADLAGIDDRFQSDWSVRHRLEGIGTVSAAHAAQIGMVGLAARASGVALDQRTGEGVYAGIVPQVEPGGDCQARVRVRIREMGQSIAWLRAALAEKPGWTRSRRVIDRLAPDQLAIAVVEGWRGEVVHVVETGGAGEVIRYKVQDPSFRNWLGLALAVRGAQISDFPVCNKSFDLSYCGHDL